MQVGALLLILAGEGVARVAQFVQPEICHLVVKVIITLKIISLMYIFLVPSLLLVFRDLLYLKIKALRLSVKSPNPAFQFQFTHVHEERI